MFNSMVEAGVTIALAIIGLAIIATLVSRNANTTGVVQSVASGLANNIGVAASPVTGAQVALNTSYPGSFGMGFGS